MRQFDCPQCGAPVVFQSDTAEAAICEHCRSVVVRKDVNVSIIGQMAVLPPDTTPLQIGATGNADGLGFRLLGRVRVGWQGGSWNEWFIEYEDHTRGWLAEAQGFFMVLRETPLQQRIPQTPEQVSAGETLVINGHPFRVTDAKPVVCLGGEGELPDPVVAGEKWQSIDVEGDAGVVASLEAADGGWRLFQGTNNAFPSLHFQNLRPVPGWKGVPPLLEQNKTGALNCPGCGGVVKLHAAGQTMTATCSHCGAVLDTSTPNLAVVQQAAKARSVKPSVPLGSRGKFDGIEWELIGFMMRHNSGSSWLEYLLFNPCHGFRWLTEYEGQWTLVDRLLESPSPNNFEGRAYRPYSDENCETVYVEGEFYWQLRRGEKAKVSDYICPPYVLSREFYPELNEITWSAGASISAQNVQQAFGLAPPKLPPPLPAGPLSTNPYRERWRSLRKVFYLAFAALFVTQLMTMHSGTGTSYKHQFTYDWGDIPAINALSEPAGTPTPTTKAPIVTEPFQITKQGAVEITATAPVSNNWLGLDLELINQTTGEHFPTELTVEYYYGRDEDGDWTEGSQTASTSIPGLPPGTYTLAMETEADPTITKMPYTIKVAGGQTYWSNFILCGLALLFWPIYNWFRALRFEVSRWAGSAHKPFHITTSSNDD